MPGVGAFGDAIKKLRDSGLDKVVTEEVKKGIIEGNLADLTVFDLNMKYKIDPAEFLSMGRATPFKDKEVYGKCMLTLCRGKVAYDSGLINKKDN